MALLLDEQRSQDSLLAWSLPQELFFSRPPGDSILGLITVLEIDMKILIHKTKLQSLLPDINSHCSGCFIEHFKH